MIKKMGKLMLLFVLAFIVNINTVYASNIATIATPTAFKAISVDYNSVNISWGAVSGASGYIVYRANSSTGSYSVIKTTTSKNYTNTGLSCGKTYFYKVRTYKVVSNKKVYSKYTKTLSVKPIPSTPTSVKGTSITENSVVVSWGKVNGASGYEVYRATSSTGSFTLLKKTTLTSYTNTELVSGKSYYYKVKAYKKVGDTLIYSKDSSVAKIVTATFDSNKAANNLITDYNDLGNGVIAIITNNNSTSVYLEATMIFYDSNGNMLGKSTDENYNFEPGHKAALFFYGPHDGEYNDVKYSSYKIVYELEPTKYISSNLSDITIKSNYGSDNVMVEVTNSGNKEAEYTQIAIVFYKEGVAVGYSSRYADVNLPQSTDYLQFSFPYDQNIDTIPVDDYQIFVNSSYRYID